MSHMAAFKVEHSDDCIQWEIANTDEEILRRSEIETPIWINSVDDLVAAVYAYALEKYPSEPEVRKYSIMKSGPLSKTMWVQLNTLYPTKVADNTPRDRVLELARKYKRISHMADWTCEGPFGVIDDEFIINYAIVRYDPKRAADIKCKATRKLKNITLREMESFIARLYRALNAAFRDKCPFMHLSLSGRTGNTIEKRMACILSACKLHKVTTGKKHEHEHIYAKEWSKYAKGLLASDSPTKIEFGKWIVRNKRKRNESKTI